MEISLKEHEKFALQASLHLEYCECSVILFLLIEVHFSCICPHQTGSRPVCYLGVKHKRGINNMLSCYLEKCRKLI